MDQFFNFLGKYIFLLLSLLLFISGTSCYFNLSKRINTLKIYLGKKKYIINNEKEYLKSEGVFDCIAGILCFIDFLTIAFKKDLIFPVLLSTTVIVNIMIYFINHSREKISKNK